MVKINKKFILITVLSIAIYVWIELLIRDLIIYESESLAHPISHYTIFAIARHTGQGIFLLFIKPIFVYVSGIVIISKLK
ncbi:hypothetical protein KAJ89_02450 [Candidatus Parcubacteria bacterium]|nr:hypothetical protein [Candidatus Parcubacteria bacterium]